MWTKILNVPESEKLATDAIPSERTPDLIFVFGETDAFGQGDVLNRLNTAFPTSMVLGCSTGTVIDGVELSDEGFRAVALGFDHTTLKAAFCEVAQRPCFAVGQSLGRQLAGADLKTIILISDGLQVNGSELVSGLVSVVGAGVSISGGLAGDGARFEKTYVAHDGKAVSGAVTAVGFYGGALRVAHGSAGGWDEFGPLRLITRSEGNVLFELDGKPALDLYERYLGEEAAGLPASALVYPLKIFDPARPQDAVVRTVLAVDRDAGSMTFAGDVPVNWPARLMRGEFEHLIDGATTAVSHALSDLRLEDPNLSPSLCLLVSCVGRRLLMGQRASDEVEAVTRVLKGELTQIGFYSYGEIAPQNESKACGLHNQTVTVTLLAEVA